MKFRIEGTTADKRLVAFGKTLEELFQNAALGMFSEIADLETVEETETRVIELKDAEDREGLLVLWLNELLFYFDSEGFVGKRFRMESLGKNSLRARVQGSRVSGESIVGEIKAATYHELEIREGEDSFEGRIILDV